LNSLENVENSPKGLENEDFLCELWGSYRIQEIGDTPPLRSTPPKDVGCAKKNMAALEVPVTIADVAARRSATYLIRQNLSTDSALRLQKKDFTATSAKNIKRQVDIDYCCVVLVT
jgi:hypothetical protein